jgi:small conductance mechanosensitive channel
MTMHFNLAEATVGLQTLIARFSERLPYMALALVVFVVFYVAGIILKKGVAQFTLRTRRHRAVGIVLGRLGQGALVLLGLLIALVIAMPGFTPGQLVSVLGLSSVAIGFAFRDILQNFLAGILLLLSEPFRIGDQIKSGDFEGTVSNIETRATFIVTYDGRRIVVPNSTLFVNPVIVNTANERRRLEYDLALPKDADIAKIKHLILRTVAPLPNVLSEPGPDVLLIGFTDKDVTLRLRWWVQPPRHFELQNGLDTVLAHVREAMLAARARASAPPQATAKQSP